MQSLTDKIWNLKNIRNSIPLLLLLLLPMPQDIQYILVQSLPIDSKYITSDYFGNFYVVTERNSLQKYTTDKPLAIWNVTKYGPLERVDASNPLKLLLFYPGYSTIVVLDQSLSQLGVYQLHLKGLTDVSAIGLAQDNNIWIYDIAAHKLKKINESADVVAESENMNALGYDLLPNYILQKNNQVYMNDVNSGIFVFDNFGTYYKTIPITGIQDFQIIDDQLIYIKEGKLHIFQLKTLQSKEMPLPDVQDIQQVSIQNNKLFVRLKNSVQVYSY